MPTLLLVVLTSLITSAGPTIATTIVDYAKNAGAVNGLKAVAATAAVIDRSGKLVATSATTGKLPNNIIAKAPDANLLDGLDSTKFYRISDTVANATHATSASDATRLGGASLANWGMASTTFNGPLPTGLSAAAAQWSFTSHVGNVLISFSGTGYRPASASTGGWIDIRLFVDGQSTGDNFFYTNETYSHRTFPTDSATINGLFAGKHSVELMAVTGLTCLQDIAICTSTDGHDRYNISLIEQPTGTSTLARPARTRPHDAHRGPR